MYKWRIFKNGVEYSAMQIEANIKSTLTKRATEKQAFSSPLSSAKTNIFFVHAIGKYIVSILIFLCHHL